MADIPRFYLTTAIDYPNSRPHIGTAFEKIGADVQARYRRMEGAGVHFLMGNDENTIKVPQRARELGVEPQSYVDQMARQFQAVDDAGDLYKGLYTGHYCTGCEAFKTEKEVAEADGKCPNHPTTPLTWVE